MLRSEVMSWPVTLAVLVVAFGSLAAAGIPLLLAILGLVATAGALWIGTRLTGITIWAMNFALMFALAVGIDYALFVVVRFRAALRAGFARSTRSPRRWTAPAGRCSSAAWPCWPRCPR